MRIAFSGSANTGKTTLLREFIRRWPMYVTPEKTYRDLIKEKNLSHSSQTTEETQLLILDWMMMVMKYFPRGSDIVYDRCPLDNLAYTLQANLNGQVSDVVTASTISLVRESLKDLDIIFWIPRNPNIIIEDDGLRDTKLEFIEQTEEIFQDLYDHYKDEFDSDVFFPADDCPAIIKLESFTLDDRLFEISQYIQPNGQLLEGGSILDGENLNLLEQMIKDQQNASKEDQKIKDLMKNITKNLR